MPMVVTAEKYVHGLCLREETLYAKRREFRQPVLAFVTTVHCLSPVRRFSVNELHQSFLTVFDVATVPASRNETYGIGLH